MDSLHNERLRKCFASVQSRAEGAIPEIVVNVNAEDIAALEKAARS
jgi:hypothetical protein